MRHTAPLIVAAVVLLLAGFVPHEGAAPARWAVIVGVGDYLNFGDEPGGDLPGATNDARNMHAVLTERWGFQEDNVRLLLDLDATRGAIETSFTEWLPSVVKPGDLVLFYYSGHGSQIWDQDGDEDDGLDETICPTDVLRGSSRMDIRDDQLGGWVADLPTNNVTVILDSCHSGTATRSVAAFARTKSLNRDPHEDLIAEQPAAAARAASSRSAFTSGADDDSFGEGVLEIAAAASHEYAIESVFEGFQGALPRPGGAFTTPLVEQLWQVPLSTSYEEVFAMAVQTMKQRGFDQTPQISGAERAGQPVFAMAGAAAAPVPPPPGELVVSAPATVDEPGEVVDNTSAVLPAPPAPAAPAAPAAELVLPSGAVPVLARSGSSVTLGGGAAAGVTIGSLYDDGANLLLVEDVTENRASASVVGDGTRGIQAVTRSASSAAIGAAHLVARAYPEARLRVTVADLPQPLRAALGSALGAASGVTLQPDPEAVAELIVRPENAGYVVLGIDGSLRHQIAESRPAAAAAALVPILRKEFSALQIAVLDNPARPFPLDLSFGGPENRFEIGDPIEFRLLAGRDGYLTIVDLDPAGAANIVFPNQFDGANRVSAGQEIVVPTPTMGFHFQAAEPAGRGIVRVFITERPLNIPSEGGSIDAGHLIAALRSAAGSAPLAGSDAIPVASWATASVVYDIER
jgi:hypothetical protein